MEGKGRPVGWGKSFFGETTVMASPLSKLAGEDLERKKKKT